MPDIHLHARRVKQLIKRSNLSGTFVVGKYRFSPYHACEHGCAYCDGRAERYYVEGDFERDIVMRENAPELLKREVTKLRERGWITLSSGVSDVYQPVEKENMVTRKCAEILRHAGFPITIMTKSDLVLRDLDIWSDIASSVGCMIIVSLTFADDSIRKPFEPSASSVEDRLHVLDAAKSAGCYTGVLAMPLIPFITDTEDQISRLYDRLLAVDPDFIMPAGLTLRPGRQKRHFLKMIKRYDPRLVAPISEIYREEWPSGASTRVYRRDLQKKIKQAVVRTGKSFLVPHYVYAPRLHRYDALSVLLSHMDELYSLHEVDTIRLQEARKRFVTWIVEKKSTYNRRPSTRYEDFDREVAEAFSSGELESVFANPKLHQFCSKIVLDGDLFDYESVISGAGHSDHDRISKD